MTDENHRGDLFRLIYHEGVHVPRNRPVVGLALMIFGGLMMFSSLGLMYAPRTFSHEFFNRHPLGLVLIIPVAFVGGELMFFGKRWLGPDTVNELAKDPRLPVLYLRGFKRDEEVKGGSRVFLFLPPATPERTLVRCLKRIGPVIALGEPGFDNAQSFGAYRLYADPLEWPKVVETLMNCCQLILLMLDNSPAVSWELARAAEICGPAKLLLGVPRPSWPEKHEYEEIREWASKALGHHLPQTIGKARYIWFQHDWTPRLISTPTEWDNFVLGTSWTDS